MGVICGAGGGGGGRGGTHELVHDDLLCVCGSSLHACSCCRLFMG